MPPVSSPAPRPATPPMRSLPAPTRSTTPTTTTTPRPNRPVVGTAPAGSPTPPVARSQVSIPRYPKADGTFTEPVAKQENNPQTQALRDAVLKGDQRVHRISPGPDARGQYWAPRVAGNEQYNKDYGMPKETDKPTKSMAGGRVNGDFVTRPAPPPAQHADKYPGGAPEVVTGPGQRTFTVDSKGNMPEHPHTPGEVMLDYSSHIPTDESKQKYGIRDLKQDKAEQDVPRLGNGGKTGVARDLGPRAPGVESDFTNRPLRARTATTPETGKGSPTATPTAPETGKGAPAPATGRPATATHPVAEHGTPAGAAALAAAPTAAKSPATPGHETPEGAAGLTAGKGSTGPKVPNATLAQGAVGVEHNFGPSAETHGHYGVLDGQAKVSAGPSVNAGAQGQVTTHGASGDAQAGADVGVKAEADAQANGRLGSAQAHAEAKAGASAQAKAHGEIGKNGAAVGVEGNAMLGASVGGEVQGNTLGGAVGGRAGAQAIAGIGVQGAADASLTWKKVGVHVKVGAALGVGGSVDLGVQFNPSAAVDMARQALNWFHW